MTPELFPGQSKRPRWLLLLVYVLLLQESIYYGIENIKNLLHLLH